jgi:hypothetical protein
VFSEKKGKLPTEDVENAEVFSGVFSLRALRALCGELFSVSPNPENSPAGFGETPTVW